MKIFRILTVLFISTLSFTGCEKEEITNYAFDEVSAPSNVTAIFDVSQDDTGTVTITPSGEGAQVFQVDLGNGETAEFAAGESVTTVYTEGEFMVNVVAVGATGLTSEYNQMLNISFSAPENLEIIVDQPASNPKTITVSATADNATIFDVYFGDVEDEEPTQLMPGESIQHTYEPGVYQLTVVARGAGAATAEEDKIIIVPEATDPLKLPINFDEGTVNYAADVFNGTSYEIVVNPDLSGANTSESNVAAVTNSGVNFEGIAYTLGEPVDFSGDNKTISMKVWSDVPLPVLLKFEGGVNDERQTEVVANHSGTGWEVLTFNFATDAIKSYIDGNQGAGEPFVPTGQYGAMVIFIDGPGTTAGTFYLDDIEKISLGAPKLPVNFENSDLSYEWSGFGAADFGPIPAGIIDNPDPSGINTSSNVLEIVKVDGAQVWAGASMDLEGAIDFSGSTTVKIKVWSPRAGTPILFKTEVSSSTPDANGNPTVFAEVIQNTTVANQWEELTFDLTSFDAFNPFNGYDRVIIFPDFNNPGLGESFYFDDISLTNGSNGGGGTATATSFPVSFETVANGGDAALWSVFENADNPPLQIISNPDASGANASMNVAKFTAKTGGQPFAGTITQLETPLTLDASNSQLKIMVWKSVISDVGIKFENAAGGSTGEIKVANTKTNEWEELTFDFSGVVGDPNNTNITGLVVFPDFQARTQDNVVYFDNITLNAASSTGGGTGGGSTNSEPSAAAPTPTLDAANVISMFSGAYTDVTVDTWRTDWSAADYEEISIASNAVKYYTNLNYVGIETTSSPVDASEMTHFHTDYWTGNAGVFRIKLVDFGPNGTYDGGDDSEHEIEFTATPNTWVSLDIPLSDFTGLTNKTNIAQYIYSATPVGEAKVYIDNVYFHK